MDFHRWVNYRNRAKFVLCDSHGKVRPCSPVEVYRRFGETLWVHIQGSNLQHDAITEKTTIWIFTDVTTSHHHNADTCLPFYSLLFYSSTYWIKI
jgi:hypothetical protein